jgi:hypothetical protein
MTAAAAGEPRDLPPPLAWTAHHQVLLYLTYAGSAVPDLWMPQDGFVSWAWLTARYAPMAFFFLAMIQHNRFYCQRCVDQTLNSGLIPSVEAERRRGSLRIFHFWHDRPWLLIAVLLLLVTAAFIPRDHRVGSVLGGALFWTFLAALAVFQGRHSRLRPWCPFCRRGDDGDDQPELVPEPTPPGATV